MFFPDELRYRTEHTWLRLEGETGVVGITDFAQDELGDLVVLVLPPLGATIQAGQRFGEVESVKTVSELIAPVSGEVVDVNAEVVDTPELVNEDPYGVGWLLRVRLSSPTEVDQLLTAEAYEAQLD